jgi:hypothetical protein
MREWLNRWINPPKKRDVNKCFCGGGLITFYSKHYRECLSCQRKYDVHDGVEIIHQR